MVFEIEDDLTLGRQGEITEGSSNFGFDTFGGDKIIVIDKKNYLSVYKATLLHNRITIKKIHRLAINGVNGRTEFGLNVIVDAKGEYAMTSQFEGNYCSNLSMFKIKEDFNLEFKTMLDIRSKKIKQLYYPGIRFMDYYANNLVFMGYSLGDKSLEFFSYDPENNEIRYLEEKRKQSDEYYRLLSLSKVKNGMFLSVNYESKLIKIQHRMSGFEEI